MKCAVCELVDVTCFASFRAQTIAEVLCHVIFFSRHFTDDTGLMHVSFFHFADDMGDCVFGICPATPMSSAGTTDALLNHYLKTAPKQFLKGYPMSDRDPQ